MVSVVWGELRFPCKSGLWSCSRLTLPSSGAHRQAAHGLHFILGHARPSGARRSCQTLGVVKALGSEVNTSRSAVAASKGPEFAIPLVLGGSFSTRTTFVLRAKPKECKVSARAEARSRANVGQSVGPQPPRVGTVRGSRRSSVVVQGGQRLQCSMYQSLSSQGATPNPSIEGMPKRLRLLCTPHVKR